MPSDTYSAVWVSHSSISDFLKCPRAYYLKNVYKSKETGRKMAITGPSLALGQSVHEVIEALSIIPTTERFRESLLIKFDRAWQKVSGKRGGFISSDQEARFKLRGEEMLRRVMQNPGPLANQAVKIKMDLPHYWLSEEEGIILCGKIDWLEWMPDSKSVSIIDFKTGKGEEDPNSLQLPIYHLLVANCQKWPVVKACYWYIEREEELRENKLPPLDEAYEKVVAIAKQIKLARKLEMYKCPTSGCNACKPLEAVLRGEAEHVGVDEINRDIYTIPSSIGQEADSIIL